MDEVKRIEAVEQELLDVCLDLAYIAGSGGLYSFGLANRIAMMGKPVDEMTVKELREMNRQYSRVFNSIREAAEAAHV